MATLPWDGVLETIVRNNKNAVIVAGHRPYLRAAAGLQYMDVPALTDDELKSMVNEILPAPDDIESIPGCQTFQIRYGADFKFRVDVVGAPPTTSLVVTRLPDDAPAPRSEGGGWFHDWKPSEWPLRMPEIIHGCMRGGGGDPLLVPGCPPLGWSRWGIGAFAAPPLEARHLASYVTEILPPPEYIDDRPGYRDFAIRYNRAHDLRVAVFGQPLPQLVLLMRLKIS